MAENGNGSSKGILFLVLVSIIGLVLFVMRGPGTKILRVAPTQEAAPQKTEPSEQPEETGSVLGSETSSDVCGERPRDDYGSCGKILGVFYDGSACVRVYGCSLLSVPPPFSHLGGCRSACETK